MIMRHKKYSPPVFVQPLLCFIISLFSTVTDTYVRTRPSARGGSHSSGRNHPPSSRRNKDNPFMGNALRCAPVLPPSLQYTCSWDFIRVWWSTGMLLFGSFWGHVNAFFKCFISSLFAHFCFLLLFTRLPLLPFCVSRLRLLLSGLLPLQFLISLLDYLVFFR